VHEVVGPSPKDGFLATNSLLLTTTVLARAYGGTLPVSLPAVGAVATHSAVLSSRLIREAGTRAAVIALASDWAVPAATDLESKWSEIGFGSVTVTDPRNFAHGRHHGLSRRIRETLVLGFATGEQPDVLHRTLDLLPARAHIEILSSPLSDEAAGLDLLVRVMILTRAVGETAGIDVGQPSVPAFGRALYHASPAPARNAKASRSVRDEVHDLWIRRKVSPAVWEGASEATRVMWRAKCREWIRVAEGAQIGAVVLDYDGTMCEEHERFGAPAATVGLALARLLDAGLDIGIATGRGDSVLTALRQVIPEPCWSRVVIGMYNGGCICRLNEWPILEDTVRPVIERAKRAIECAPHLAGLVDMRERPTQLTLRCTRPLPEGLFYRMVLEALGDFRTDLPLRAVASGHTVDLVAAGVSKLCVVDAIRAACSPEGVRTRRGGHGRRNPIDTVAIMTIGDQGQLGGNDAAFLAHPLGLSVENVSSVFGECWNVAPAGLRRTAALHAYLEALQVTSEGSCRWSVTVASRTPRGARSTGPRLVRTEAV